MSAADLLSQLWLASWTGSLAIALVLVSRKPMRARLGAGLAYAAWAIVPLAWLGLLLPAPVVERAAGGAYAPAMLMPVLVVEHAAPAPSWHVAAILLGLWLLGGLALLARLMWQQRRFVLGLGRLRDDGDEAGVWLAESVAGLPALVGLWHPKVVLPADVHLRYDADERRLMVLHERAHQHAGDHWVNALVLLLRCLFWFNPLVHFAAGRLRHDQELACDARVLRHAPGTVRRYAQAMLKTSLSTQPVPLGCHWTAIHPLKERLMMLKQPLPSPANRIAGALLLLVGACSAGAAAWSTQPPHVVTEDGRTRVRGQGMDYVATIAVVVDGQASGPATVVGGYANKVEWIHENDGSRMRLELLVTPVVHDGNEAYRLDVGVHRNGRLVASPALVARPGEDALIRLEGSGAHELEASFTVRAVSAEDLERLRGGQSPATVRQESDGEPSSMPVSGEPRKLDSIEAVVAEGAREIEDASARKLGLDADYRWADVTGLLSGDEIRNIILEGDVVSVPEDGDGPMRIGFRR
ncbi:MAG: M56 family metallopeptidase [Pseudoxanthomonas suwonensis]|nr:M56 family metallopeptidase [Pseudoxanthomonas suwonensis]